MKVDEFLKQQHESGLEIVATIESTDDRPGYVKVTPYSRTGGCRCSHSFALEVTHIDDVLPTGETIWCCGKHLKVAKLVIRKGATVPIADVLATTMRQGGGLDDPTGACVSSCADGYRSCKRHGGKNCA